MPNVISYRQVMKELKALSNPANVEGMAHFGINPRNTLGISVVNLRKIAKRVGKNHSLAQKLWNSGIHEARNLASMVDDVALVTAAQTDDWVRDFDSWDVCDQCCGNLFDKTPFTYAKAEAWSSREEEFVKRAAFSLMAYLAVHDKKASDREFIRFLKIIRRESNDDRNFVKKAVNWALRGIGKRNSALNAKAIETARQIQAINSRSARWIAADALKELTSLAVQKQVTRTVTKTARGRRWRGSQK